MAITKLMHMKECPDYAPKHLVNAVSYILDVKHEGEKTDYGRYVGGNVGSEASEIVEAFLDTKNFFGKTNGRQGYHFVISFKEGECDRETCYRITEEFCRKYLGDEYEYVFALHNDKAHSHAHIIFNSLSRTTGLKFRYEKGDWEKYIQPITDSICKKHGISPLEYEEVRKGRTYAEWQYEKNQASINWKHIIMADVDYALLHAGGQMEVFLANMKRMGYTFRLGRRKEKNDITFTMTDHAGKKHRKRLSSLPAGYTYEDVLDRLKYGDRQKTPFYKTMAAELSRRSAPILSNAAVLHGTETYRRLYQAVNYYALPNPYAVPASRVRTDMKRIGRLIEQCAYLKKHLLKENIPVQEKARQVDNKLHALYVKRKHLYRIREEYQGSGELEAVRRYMKLEEQLTDAKEWGEREEDIQEEMWELEETIPKTVLSNEQELATCKYDIAALVKERRMLWNILNTEKGKWADVNLNAERKPNI